MLLSMLRGMDAEPLSCEHNVTVADISNRWFTKKILGCAKINKTYLPITKIIELDDLEAG